MKTHFREVFSMTIKQRKGYIGIIRKLQDENRKLEEELKEAKAELARGMKRLHAQRNRRRGT